MNIFMSTYIWFEYLKLWNCLYKVWIVLSGIFIVFMDWWTVCQTVSSNHDANMVLRNDISNNHHLIDQISEDTFHYSYYLWYKLSSWLLIDIISKKKRQTYFTHNLCSKDVLYKKEQCMLARLSFYYIFTFCGFIWKMKNIKEKKTYLLGYHIW